MQLKPLAVITFLWGILVSHLSVAAISWNVEKVHEPAYFRVNSRALAIDGSNRPSVFYGGSHLYRQYYDGTQWRSEVIDDAPRTGLYANSVVDSQGYFHVIYWDDYKRQAKYATNRTGSWVHTALTWYPRDPVPHDIALASIAVDSKNAIHIAYRQSTGVDTGLSYATNASGVWQTEVVEPSRFIGTGGVTISVDSQDDPHIVYKDPETQALKHAFKSQGAAWSTEVVNGAPATIASTAYQQNSTIIDGGDTLHIAFPGDAGDLYYATNPGGVWSVQLVADLTNGDLARYPSIALDSTGKVYISYRIFESYPAQTDLQIVSKASGSWIPQSLGIFNWDDSYTSLASDSADNLHLAVFSANTLSLDYFTNQSGSWVSAALATSEEGNLAGSLPNEEPVGGYTSLGRDSSGFLHISYTKQISARDEGKLMYATNKGGNWIWTALTNGFNPVWQNSIAADSNGFVHIIYRDSNNVNYITNKTGAWVSQAIELTSLPFDADGKMGIKIDNNDDVHIAYMNYAGDVRYANNKSGGWIVETAAQTGDTFGNASGYSVALNVDVNGFAHLAYLDRNADVAYATNTNGSWSDHVVALRNDAMPNPWHSNEIMVDSRGYVHMVYESPFCTGTCFPDSLTYATNASGAWVTDVVDADGFLVTAGAGIEQRNLRHPTLFIDDMNKPHLAYMSVYSNTIAAPEILEVTIKYAYKLGDIWRSYDVDYMPDLFKPVTSSDENGKAYISVHSDVNGNPAFSYHDAANGGLKLATGTTVASPSLEAGVTPNDGDFGSINVGQSAGRQFRLSNIGQLDLVISNISLSGVDTDQFILDFNTGIQPCGNNNAILAPGDYCTFSMLFTPTRSGQAAADVEIATNDPELGLVGASFTGVAAVSTAQSGGGGCSLAIAQNKEVNIPAYWIGLILSVVIRVFLSTKKGAEKPKKRYFVRYP